MNLSSCRFFLLLLLAPVLPAIMVRGAGDTDRANIFGSDLELGGFWASLKTVVRLDGLQGQVGTRVRFETDLEFSSRKSLPFFQGSWRFSDNWLVQVDYVNLDRASVHTIETEIEWPPGDDGETFPVGAELASFLKFESSRIAFAYIIQTLAESELAVVGGIHLTDVGAGIALAVDVNGRVGSVREDLDFGPVPLPSVGLYWGIRLAEKWMVRVRGDFLYLKIGDYSGGLVSTRLDASYQLAKNWSVGAGLHYYHIAVDGESRHFYGRVDFSYQGPSAFLRYSF